MDLPVRFDDEMEEGEVGPVDDYDPAFEYPGNSKEVSQYPPQPRRSSPSPPAASATNKTTVFRLIVLHSTVLGPLKRIAAFDGHTQISIGRDVASSARVRLKEMAVSKFHASVYWDGSRREWGIVDMGSVHGTFVRSAQHPSTSTAASQATPGTRLSEPRKASMPKVLRHLDEITIGGTTFLVHEHLAGRPCLDCTIEGDAEIPLFSTRSSLRSSVSKDDQSLKRKHVTDSGERDVKKSMAKLKSSLLSRHTAPGSLLSPSNATYKDRSARRRELHPEPRVQSLPNTTTRSEPQSVPVPAPRIQSPPPSPPQPVPSSNIGHKLLLLQGWNPGTALGEDPNSGLLEPLKLSANTSRAGLGSSGHASHFTSEPPEDWKEDAKRRRWDGIKGR